jgi:hypothetical protein
MKNPQQALNEFLKGIQEMIQQFPDADLLKLHDLIYTEISVRKFRDRQAEKKVIEQ